jgi:uncharacterized protein YifE (UPF0438 family)
MKKLIQQEVLQDMRFKNQKHLPKGFVKSMQYLMQRNQRK